MSRMTMLKSLHMHYYAAFRDATGLREETVQSTAMTAAELYQEIAAHHGLPFDLSSLRVALNDQIVPWTSQVTDGDSVVFLAPFAGG